MPNIQLREPTPADWEAIARVANEALPHAADRNAEWLTNRRAFDTTGRARRHYVATQHDGAIIAYGAIEEGNDGRVRFFAVMGAQHLSGAVGDLIYKRLHRDLMDLGAQVAWIREQADDHPIIAFATAHGFHETRRFTHQGTDIVELELLLVP